MDLFSLQMLIIYIWQQLKYTLQKNCSMNNSAAVYWEYTYAEFKIYDLAEMKERFLIASFLSFKGHLIRGVWIY